MNLGLLLEFRIAAEHAGLPVPTAVTRGLEILEIARAHVQTPAVTLLDMSPDEVRAQLTDLAIRSHTAGANMTPGLAPALPQLEAQLAVEIRAAALGDLDGMIESLQPRFGELAAPLVTAAQVYGFTRNTTSDQVIDMANEQASAAWREARDAWTAIGPIVRFRQKVSEIFEVSPTKAEMDQFYGFGAERDTSGLVDYSVCFAAHDNWSYDGGYYVKPRGRTNSPLRSHLDWYALAVGGLHLNTPTEVAAKLEQRRVRALQQQAGTTTPALPETPTASGAVIEGMVYPRT